jgi:hypothetical protein
MPKKLDPITRINKDVAEYFAGHAPGRPTISRRTGRALSDLTGFDEDLCVHGFHAALFLAGVWGLTSLAPKRTNAQGGA